MNFTRNGVVLAQARATAMTPTTLTGAVPDERHGHRTEPPRALRGGGGRPGVSPVGQREL